MSDDFFKKLSSLILKYDILSFTKEENEQILNPANLDRYIFLSNIIDINIIGKMIYHYTMTKSSYKYLDVSLWMEGLDWIYDSETNIYRQETKSEMEERVYKEYVEILNNYNKQYNVWKQLLLRLLLTLKYYLIGNSSFYPNFIGKYLLKIPYIRNIIFKY